MHEIPFPYCMDFPMPRDTTSKDLNTSNCFWLASGIFVQDRAFGLVDYVEKLAQERVPGDDGKAACGELQTSHKHQQKCLLTSFLYG